MLCGACARGADLLLSGNRAGGAGIFPVLAGEHTESGTESGVGERGEKRRASVAAKEAENAGKAGETSKVKNEAFGRYK